MDLLWGSNQMPLPESAVPAELEQTGRAALGPPGQDAQATCTEKNSYSKKICIFLD